MKNQSQCLPVVIHDDIMSMIYNYYHEGNRRNDTGLAYAIYAFLYHTARRQNNIRVYATDTFIRKGVGIGSDKLKVIKRDLRAMDLIEIIRPRDNKGHFTDKSYIEVKFVWKGETVDKLFYQENSSATEYKIARSLLINNFNPYEEIKSSELFEFNAVLNGQDASLFADSFYFDDNDVLVAIAGFHEGENDFDYTVTTEKVNDVIMVLARSYKFSFIAVMNTLSSSNTLESSIYQDDALSA